MPNLAVRVVGGGLRVARNAVSEWHRERELRAQKMADMETILRSPELSYLAVRYSSGYKIEDEATRFGFSDEHEIISGFSRDELVSEREQLLLSVAGSP